MMYFTNIKCIEDLKEAYISLVKLHHPDKGGDLEIMKAINVEYDKLFAKYKDIKRSLKENEEVYTSKNETKEAPEQFRTILETLLKLDGVTVELVGSWIWITGDTKVHKDILKSLGCRYSPKKLAWSWHFKDDWSFSRKGNNSLDDIRATYGSVEFTKSQQQKMLTV